MHTTTLNGLVMRAPTRDDAQAITDLVNQCAVADGDTPDLSLADLLAEWQNPRFSLTTDAWLVTTADGRTVGYEEAFREDDTRFRADGYVHPEQRGRGIGTTLLGLAERWARERLAVVPAAGRVVLRAGVSGNDTAAHALFADAGFTVVRHFWRMEIEFEKAPPLPEWPAGLVVRTFVPGQDDRALYDALQEAFADHWEHVPEPFVEWAQGRVQRADFDPSLCFLAVEGAAIAGSALCWDRMGAGWVRTLGVRRPWRRRGLAMALLRHAFSTFYQRGARTVGLGVDAQNPTGATHLYEQAGMRVAQRYLAYEKELLAGQQSASSAGAPWREMDSR